MSSFKAAAKITLAALIGQEKLLYDLELHAEDDWDILKEDSGLLKGLDGESKMGGWVLECAKIELLSA